VRYEAVLGDDTRGQTDYTRWLRERSERDQYCPLEKETRHRFELDREENEDCDGEYKIGVDEEYDESGDEAVLI
jgi:hypothetical protein